MFCVFYVEISRIVVLNCEYSGMIVEKFNSITLFDEGSDSSKKTDRRSGLENYFLKNIK